MVSKQDILNFYKYILGRDGDAGGILNYEDAARNGMSWHKMRMEFIRSVEFGKSFGGHKAETVKVGDVFVVVDADEIDFGATIYRDAAWEAHIVSIIRSNLKQGDTFVDIGGNVGVMSFVAAQAVGPAGKVLAFEPHPDNVRHFLLGVAANRFNNVKLHGFALSDQQMVFSILGSSNGFLASAEEAAYQCISVRGDDILGDEQRIDFIKIDIEGHEPQALAGLSETIAKHKPNILCEFNPRCLTSHIGRPPLEFAEQLFSLSNVITVIEHSGKQNQVGRPSELIDLWQEKNSEAVQTGHLTDGMLHFDLLLKPD